MNYALDALNNDSLPLPDRLVLMSPAIGIPPVLAFVPLVDATVSTADTIEYLFQRLNRPEDELVLYDINRSGRVH